MKRMADIFRGRIIDVTDKHLHHRAHRRPARKLDAFLQALDQGAIIETVRTGAIGIGRGERGLAGLASSSFYQGNSNEGLLRQGRRPFAHQGQEGHHHRLRLAGPRARAEPARTPASRSPSACARAAPRGTRRRRPASRSPRSAEAVKGADIVMMLLPDEHIAAGLQGRHRAQHQEGRDARLRARLQHPLRPDPAARRPRRRDGRAEGARPHRALDLCRRRRRADADRGAPAIRPRRRATSRCPTPRRSAAARPASSRPISGKRPRPISSASRPCCAAAASSW